MIKAAGCPLVRTETVSGAFSWPTCWRRTDGAGSGRGARRGAKPFDCARIVRRSWRRSRGASVP